MTHIGDFALAELVGPDGRPDTPILLTLKLIDGQPPAHIMVHLIHRYARNGRHPSGLLIYRRI